jgi:tetratricopeptide (TPR) repeat protein
MDDSQNRRQNLLICLGLALAVLALYSPLWSCEFIIYDDPDYITTNDMIQHGVNGPSLAWAFSTGHSSNWHPLTWISHMLDFQLYGLHPAGHHFTSLLLHLANSILLFLLVLRMTGARWPAAMVAALFALHPLHVESVAWVSERKDVLSTLFWMLTVWAYLGYVEQTRVQGPRRALFYSLAVLLFALGLMAKPMLVTLPFVLLLLDYWPLRRFPPARPPWREKIPFFILAAAASAVTFLVQKHGGAVMSFERIPLGLRLANIPIAYVRYIGKTFWPFHLAILYPYPPRWPVWKITGALAILALITAWVVRRARAQPYLLVGWLWFLGVLAPVIGLVQVGFQDMADRYSYISIVGLFIMVVWSVREWSALWPARLPAVLAGSAVAACLVLTPWQVSHWKNTPKLFTHAVTTTDDNYLAYYDLGSYYALIGQRPAAIKYLEQSVRIIPNHAVAQNNLGKVLFLEGRVDEALVHLSIAVALRPELPEVHYNLGNALLAKGRIAEALDHFQQHVDLLPDDPVAQNNFANVLLDQGLPDDAMPHFQKVLQLRPDSAEAHYKLGNILLQKGRTAEAVAQYQQALQIRPDYLQACSNLAWALATSPLPAVRQGARAVELARRAERLSDGTNPLILGVLAAAYAETGQFPQSVATAQRARQLAQAQTNNMLADALDRQLRFYKDGLPFREPSSQEEGK